MDIESAIAYIIPLINHCLALRFMSNCLLRTFYAVKYLEIGFNVTTEHASKHWNDAVCPTIKGSWNERQMRWREWNRKMTQKRRRRRKNDNSAIIIIINVIFVNTWMLQESSCRRHPHSRRSVRSSLTWLRSVLFVCETWLFVLLLLVLLEFVWMAVRIESVFWWWMPLIFVCNNLHTFYKTFKIHLRSHLNFNTKQTHRKKSLGCEPQTPNVCESHSWHIITQSFGLALNIDSYVFSPLLWHKLM